MLLSRELIRRTWLAGVGVEGREGERERAEGNDEMRQVSGCEKEAGCRVIGPR